MKPGLVPDMPFLTDDWLLSPSIAAMSPAEEGAYVRLLCYAWRDPECCLRDDDTALAGLSRLGPAWGDGSGARIRKNFQADRKRPGFIYNAKQRDLREAQLERISRASEHGTLAINTRWHGKSKGYGSNTRVIPEKNPRNTSLIHTPSVSMSESMGGVQGRDSKSSQPPAPAGAAAPKSQPRSGGFEEEAVWNYAAGRFHTRTVEAFLFENRNQLEQAGFRSNWRKEFDAFAPKFEGDYE